MGSRVEEDRCGVCGGDDSTCHVISGIFQRVKLKFGYNHVIRLPVGACRVNVTEVPSNTNFLGQLPTCFICLLFLTVNNRPLMLQRLDVRRELESAGSEDTRIEIYFCLFS